MMPNRDDCLEFENNLPLHVGGDLEPEAADAMTRHRETCADCRRTEERARASRDLLVSTLRVTERRGPDLWSGVRAGLVSEGLVRPAAAPAPALAAPRRARRVPFALATAAAVVVGFWLGQAWLHSDRTSDPVDPGVRLTEHTSPSVRPGAHGATGSAVDEMSLPVVDPTEVAGTTGLRHLLPGEAPLREGATIYTGFEWEDGPVLLDPNVVQPATLRSPTGPR